jgi:hypothetical protein
MIRIVRNKKRDWTKEAENICWYYSRNKQEVINELMVLIYEMNDKLKEC